MIKQTQNVPVLGSSGGRSAPMGHAIWEFDGERWDLKKSFAKEGAAPGPAPSIEGRFAGQLRSTPCVAK